MYIIKVNKDNLKITTTGKSDLLGLDIRLLIVLHERGYNATACEEKGKISVMISKSSLQNIINTEFNPSVIKVL